MAMWLAAVLCLVSAGCPARPAAKGAPQTRSAACDAVGQTEQITPNSYSNVSVGDTGNKAWVELKIGNEPYWKILLSNSSATLALPSDRGNGLVRFMQGLTVRYQADAGGTVQIMLSGKIIDDGTEYPVNGKLLGKINCSQVAAAIGKPSRQAPRRAKKKPVVTPEKASALEKASKPVKASAPEKARAP